MRRINRKYISGFLAVFYLVFNVALGSAAETNLWSQRKKVQLASLPVSFQPFSQLPAPRKTSFDSSPKWNLTNPDLKNLVAKISPATARIQDVFDSGELKSAPVLLVQDVHLNLEAQTHIDALLQELINQKWVEQVGVEGAFGPFDLGRFRAYADKSITNTVAKTYLDQKLLSAPSYAGVTSPVSPPPFLGIDDKAQYDANVQAYLQSRIERDAIAKALMKKEEELAGTKSKTFSDRLGRFDNLRRSYHRSDVGFGPYLRGLRSFADTSSLVIDQFLEAYEMESRLDFDRVEKERKSVISQLAEKLSEKDLSALVDHSIAYRTGKLGFGSYYAVIERLCEQAGVSLRDAPVFKDYIRYVLLSEGIQPGLLFDAVEAWEEEIIATLATTSSEKELLEESEYLSLVRKLLDFSLTPKEWAKYQKFAQNQTTVFKPRSLKTFDRFYIQADLRSDSMMNNVEFSKPTVLVVGGFHTPRMTDILKKRRISYVVVSPKVTKIDDASGSAYLSVFAREKTPLDKLFSGEKLFLSPPTHLQPGQKVYESFSSDLARAQGVTPTKNASIESLLRFIEASRKKEYRDSMRLFVSTLDSAVEFVQMDGPLDWVYRRMGYAFSEILKNAVILGAEYKNSKSRVDQNFLRPRLAGLRVSFHSESDGTYVLSVENPAEIDPKAFSTKKLTELKKILEHLYYLSMHSPESGEPAPHSELAHLRLDEDVEELASDIVNHLGNSIDLVGRMIEKSRLEGLTVDDAKELIFAPFVTTKLDLVVSRYFDWDGKPESEVDDFFGGRGLGMASARRFLGQLGIRVAIESGEGRTRFIIRVPGQLVKNSAPLVKSANPASIFYRHHALALNGADVHPVKAWLGHPYFGAPLWEVIFVLPGLLISHGTMDWLSAIFLVTVSVAVFAGLHGEYSIVEKFDVAAVGFFLNTVALLPVLFFGPSGNTIFAGLLGSSAMHVLYNFLIIERVGVFKHFPLASILDGFSALKGLVVMLGTKVAVINFELLEGLKEITGEQLLWSRDTEIGPERFHQLLEYMRAQGQKPGGERYRRIYNQLLVSDDEARKSRRELNALVQKGSQGLMVSDKGILTSPEQALSALTIGAWRGVEGSPYHPLAVIAIALAEDQHAIFSKYVQTQITKANIGLYTALFLQPFAFPYRFSESQIDEIKSAFQMFGFYRGGTSSSFLRTPSEILGDPGFAAHLSPAMLAYVADPRRANQPLFKVAFELLFLTLMPEAQRLFRVSCQEFLSKFGPLLSQQGRLEEFAAAFAAADQKMTRVHKIWMEALGLDPSGPAPLVSLSTWEDGRRRGLSNSEIRLVFAPKVEVLDALRPKKFLKAHDNPLDPKNGEKQQKRKQGIRQIWFAMVGSSIATGVLISLFEIILRVIAAEQIPLWVYWAPAFTPLVSIAWGYILLFAGQRKYLANFRLYKYPLFWPFLPAFYGNYVAHHKWNAKHPQAALVSEYRNIPMTPENVRRIIESHGEVRRAATEGRLNGPLFLTLLYIYGDDELVDEAFKKLEKDGFLKITKTLPPVVFYGLADRSMAPSASKEDAAQTLLTLLQSDADLARAAREGQLSIPLIQASGKIKFSAVRKAVQALVDQEHLQPVRGGFPQHYQLRSSGALVLPDTQSEGRRRGLSDQQIREQFAPVVESLAILKPFAFWKAHEDPENGLNLFAQAKRKQGIALVWAAMIFSASLPLGVVPLTFQFVLNVDVPLWLFVAAPVFSAAFSILWGVGLLTYGQSERFFDSPNPFQVPLQPLFLPFFPAFYGSALAHHWWNKKYSIAALTLNPGESSDDNSKRFEVGHGITAVFRYNGVEDSFPFHVQVNGERWNVDIDENVDDGFVLRSLDHDRKIEVSADEHRDFTQVIYGVLIKIVPERGIIGFANQTGQRMIFEPQGLFHITLSPSGFSVFQPATRSKPPLAHDKVSQGLVRMEAQFRLAFSRASDDSQRIVAVGRLRRQMKAFFRKGGSRELLLTFLPKLNDSVLSATDYRLVPDPNGFQEKFRLFELGKIARRETFSFGKNALPVVLVNIISRANSDQFHGHNHLGSEAVFVLDVFEKVPEKIAALTGQPVPPEDDFPSEILHRLFKASHAFATTLWANVEKKPSRLIDAIVSGHAAHFSEHEQRRRLKGREPKLEHEGLEEQLALLRSIRDANPYFEILNILGLISQGANHLPVLLALLGKFESKNAIDDLEGLVADVSKLADRPEQELRDRAARAYAVVEKQWLASEGLSSEGGSGLSLPSTWAAGRQRNLSDRQIREELAPVIESLDVLRPIKFWKAHAKLGGSQWKRLRGVAQIWLAMVWTSALPGGLVSVILYVGHVITQLQIPMWMYWAPPVATLVGSVGWGYVLLFSGYSQKLQNTAEPVDLINSLLFLPFRFAFNGNFTEHTWWNTEHPDATLTKPGTDWLSESVPILSGKKIVEVTMEMALSGPMLRELQSRLSPEDIRAVAMATSTGGIGPLLKERVIAQSELGADVIGVSLLYDSVWTQHVETDPSGRKSAQMTLRKVETGKHLRGLLEEAGHLSMQMHDGAWVQVRVWKSRPGQYGRGTVYFLDFPSITNVVYPGKVDSTEFGSEEELRLAQNWLLGRGTLALLKMLYAKPDIMILSEMPSIFAFHRLVRDSHVQDGFFENTRYVFNDHTPLDYAHPHWNEAALQKLRIDPRYYRNLALGDKDGLDGTALIINAMDGVFGVARKHQQVMQAMPLLRQFREKIGFVTNGVSASYWPDETLRDHSSSLNTDRALIEYKQRRRHDLIRFLADRQGLGAAWAEKMIANNSPVGIWTRRIVEYKRLDRFASLLEDAAKRQRFINTNIIFVVGGRTHQNDRYGIEQFNRIQRMLQAHPILKERVIFFNDYNIWEAPHLFQGADFSVMLADDGREASATGFQKAQMNGALVIASHDGAVPESVIFLDNAASNVAEANGFEVPYVDNKPTDEGLMRGFEQVARVIGVPAAHAQMIRNALNQTSFVRVDRTAQDMLRFLGAMVLQKSNEKNADREGRAAAREILSAAALNDKKIDEIRGVLNGAPRFHWTYQPYGANPVTLIASEPGLRGFAESVRTLRSLGTVGEWSLLFHAFNHSGVGDLAVYLRQVFKDVTELKPVLDKINLWVSETQGKNGNGDKLDVSLKILGLVDQTVKSLYGAGAAFTHPATDQAGRDRGLSDRQIREEFAPFYEALDVLSPIKFWKAHDDPENGFSDIYQAKRKLGLVWIWSVMILTSALPGFVCVLFIHAVFGPAGLSPLSYVLWSAVSSGISIGWGYLMRAAGASQTLRDAPDPFQFFFHPYFMPFFFAFLGNFWAHEMWNKKYPSAALVRGESDKLPITPDSVWRTISTETMTRHAATEDRLTLAILVANFSAAGKEGLLLDVLKRLVDQGKLRIARVAGPATYYGFADAKNRSKGRPRSYQLSDSEPQHQSEPVKPIKFAVGQKLQHVSTGNGRVVGVSAERIVIHYGDEGDANPPSMTLTQEQAQTAIAAGRLRFVGTSDAPSTSPVDNASVVESSLKRRYGGKTVEWIRASVTEEEYAALRDDAVTFNAIGLSFSSKSKKQIDELKELLRFLGPVKYAGLTGKFSGITPSLRRALDNFSAANKAVGKAAVFSMKKTLMSGSEYDDWFAEWQHSLMNGDPLDAEQATKRLANELAFQELVGLNRTEAAKIRPATLTEKNPLALRQRVSNLRRLMGDPVPVHKVLARAKLSTDQKRAFWWWLIESGLPYLNSEWFERFLVRGVDEFKTKNFEPSTDSWLRPTRLLMKAVLGAAPLMLFVFLHGFATVGTLRASSEPAMATSTQIDPIRDRQKAVEAILGNVPVEKYFGDFRGFVGTVDQIEQPSFVSWVNNVEQGEKLIRSALKNPQARLVLGVDEKNKDLLASFAASPFARKGRLAVVGGSSSMSALDLVRLAKESPVFRSEPNVRLSLMVLDDVQLPSSFFQLSSSDWDRLRAQAVVYFLSQTMQALELPQTVLENWTAFREALKHA